MIQLYTERLKNALLSKEEEMMNYTFFSEKGAVISTIIDGAETLPFLAERRFIVIKESGLFAAGRKDDSERMSEYVANIPKSSCLLFIEETIDKRGKLYKAIVKQGYVVEMKSLSDKELSRFLIGESKKSGLVLGEAVADYFCRTVGGSMDGMLLELAKLCAYKGNEGSIAKEDIDNICSKSLELRIFDLVDAMGGKNPQLALDIYRNLIQRKESPIMVLAMLTRQFRMIYQCKVLAELGMSQGEISAQTGLRDFMVRGSLKQGSQFKAETLKLALEKCLQTDTDIKTGRMNGELAVEMILLEYSIA